MIYFLLFLLVVVFITASLKDMKFSIENLILAVEIVVLLVITTGILYCFIGLVNLVWEWLA